MTGLCVSSYPKYRATGRRWLGDVPAHWNLKPLKHLCTFLGGSTPSKESLRYWDGGSIPWVSPKDMKATFISATEDRITEAALAESPLTCVAPGALLMVVRSGILQRTIPVAINAVSVTLNQDMKALVFRDHIAARYFFYLVQGHEPALLQRWAKDGATVESIEHGFLANDLIPEVPAEECAAIVAFLDHETSKIDALIEKQQQLIALLKEKRQAVISHAVTKGLNPEAPMRDSGVEWLGEVPAHWSTATLKHHTRVIDCKHLTAEFVDDGIPLASIGEVKGWEVDLSSAKRTTESFFLALIGGGRDPRPGDIIYTRNATVGEAAIVPADFPRFAMGQDVCLIRPGKRVHPEFLMYYLKSPVVGAQVELAMVGATFKRINVDDIRNFALTLPPLEEQVAIVDALSLKSARYDVLIDAAESAVSTIQERRTALISAAVTGKIDVRGWKPPEAASESASA